MTDQQKQHRINLINQAIKLDLEEIAIWKKSPNCNTEFARNNVIQAMESIKTLAKLKP